MPPEQNEPGRRVREALAGQVASILKTLIRFRYFSFEMEGTENLPKRGPVIYTQNHAGWLALDTVFVGFAVAEVLGPARIPYYAAHQAALTAPVLGPFLRRLGALPAPSFTHPERLPPDIECYGICPEGTRGNCKPFWQAYRMRDWSRSFVRLALALDAPIVPVAVIGGEESLPVAWTVEVLKPLIGSVIGLPLAPVPLPARWKVVFHEPIRVTPHGPRNRPDPQYCAEIAKRTQDIVQTTLDGETRFHPLAQFSSLVASVSDAMRREEPPDMVERDPLLPPDEDVQLRRTPTRRANGPGRRSSRSP
ncbi:MAG TPA: 1-acyl-sn-glycerol-3-phosphate acyltransferase [Anaeromyxobacteraceae bacterium]|nr:1-acyl-sn-glycerol-3-phosphate acyltransferase [Anaeromyxobacteraceae bacterium]